MSTTNSCQIKHEIAIGLRRSDGKMKSKKELIRTLEQLQPEKKKTPKKTTNKTKKTTSKKNTKTTPVKASKTTPTKTTNKKKKRQAKTHTQQKSSSRQSYSSRSQSSAPRARDNSFDFILYTDGSCLKNPGGSGGWAFVDVHSSHKATGSKYSTTNNEMELMAIVEALEWVKCKSGTSVSVRVYSDSQYAVNSIMRWSHAWARNGWKTRDNRPVKNKDLMKWLYRLAYYEFGKVDIVWVKGHAGQKYNEIVDKMSRASAIKALTGKRK